MCEESPESLQTTNSENSIVISVEASNIAKKVIDIIEWPDDTTRTDAVEFSDNPTAYFSKLAQLNLPPETLTHNTHLSQNITEFISTKPKILAQLNLSEIANLTNLIQISTTLHDIGKIGIDAKLDEKSWDQLSETEQQRYKTHHTSIGVYILAHILDKHYSNNDHKLIQSDEIGTTTIDLNKVTPENYSSIDYTTIFKIINNHHKPYTKIPQDIPSHILSIFDVMDSLTTYRKYNATFTLEDALSHILFNTGLQFNPEIIMQVFTFLDNLDDDDNSPNTKPEILSESSSIINEIIELNAHIKESDSFYILLEYNDEHTLQTYTDSIQKYIENLESRNSKKISTTVKSILFQNLLEKYLYNGHLSKIFERDKLNFVKKTVKFVLKMNKKRDNTLKMPPISYEAPPESSINNNAVFYAYIMLKMEHANYLQTLAEKKEP